eukprot:COSAG05_NODE_451_length_9719_cov_13.497921_9_plen_38_part_00
MWVLLLSGAACLCARDAHCYMLEGGGREAGTEAGNKK